jgi:ribonuclease BN (tRNA processing enzyme)
MLITHGHPDHFVDIIPTFYARHYGGLGEPGLPLWSPGGFIDIVAALVAENGRNVMAEAYAFRTAVAGEVFELGPFRVTPYEMEHIGVLSLGYRIESGGKVLSYTGDTGPCEAATALAKDADLFLCEATYQNASRLYPFHLSASQAGELGNRGGAGHLVLTHLTPELDHLVSIREAADTFDGPIDIAVPGMVLEVGR